MARGARRVLYGHDARAALLRGMDVLADTVAATLGPAGRTVIIERPFAKPIISRNGHAIAKHVHLDEPMANMGVRALREVAWRTSDEVGDGTTTAMVLARAMVRDGIKATRFGLNPRHLQQGFDLACAAGIAALKELSRPAQSIEQLARVATLATNGDAELGAILGEAVGRVGSEGFVLVEAGHGRASELELREGMHLDKGFISARFATNDDETLVELDDPYILLHLGRIENLGAIVPVLNAFAKSGKPLLVIAEDVAGDALSTLVVNKLKAGFKVAAAYAPGFGERRGEMLEDVAIATGGRIVAVELGNRLENLRPDMLGRARRVRITQDATTIIEGAGRAEEIAFRARQLRAAIEREQHLSYDREQLQQRLARLVSGIALVRVGGATESEIGERKERAEAAVHAVRAASASGILPGGGAALVFASRALAALQPDHPEQRLAIDIVRRAMCAPARRIADNAGADGRWVVARLLDGQEPDLGFDAGTGRICDLRAAGIVDPTEVVCCAFRNAISAAARIVLSEAAVAPVEPESA
jgi:chaperonin GroEL